MINLGIYNKAPSKKKKYEPKLYQSMRYPGEIVQVDAKYEPKACITKELIDKWKILSVYSNRWIYKTKSGIKIDFGHESVEMLE